MDQWIEVPKCGEVYIPTLKIRIVPDGYTPRVYDAEGVHHSDSWFRIDETQNSDLDMWLFTSGSLRALAVKTVYRSAFYKSYWIKVYPR